MSGERFHLFDIAGSDLAAERGQYPLYGFDVVNPGGPEAVVNKLLHYQDLLAQGGSMRMCIDFDRTLSFDSSPETWVVAARTLQGDLQLASMSERARNKKKQDDGLLTDIEEANWSYDELVRLILNGNADRALTEAVEAIGFRSGARRIFRQLELNPAIVPIIVSGGVGNVIEKVLESNRVNIPPQFVIANRFTPVQPGQSMIYPRFSDIVGSHNKIEKIRQFFPRVDSEAGCTIAVGDSVADAKMAFGGLAIRICKPNGNDWDYIDESAAAGFDLVLRMSNIIPIAELLEQLTDAVHGFANR